MQEEGKKAVEGEEVKVESLIKSDEKIKGSLENLTKSFTACFSSLQSQMKEASESFESSKPVTDIAKAITRIQSAGFDLHKLQSEINGAKVKYGNQLIPVQGNVFNIKAYESLYVLERYLRTLINVRIIEHNKSNLENKILPEMLKEWESRKEEEEKNPVIDGNYELIDYSDFTDLKRIFEKGRNYKLFEDIINQEHFKVVISKLHELDPIRKKIAHSRSLSKKEMSRLVLYTEDIRNCFKHQ